MPIYLREPQFLIRSDGRRKRRIQLLALKPQAASDIPTLKVSDGFDTRRQGLFILERFRALKLITDVNVSRLRDELDDLKLAEGGFVELCSDCGKHGSIRLGKALLGDFDCKEDARRVAQHVETSLGVSTAIRALIEADIGSCALPERPTESHPDKDLFAGINEALKSLDGVWKAVQTATRVFDLRERHTRRAGHGPGKKK